VPPWWTLDRCVVEGLYGQRASVHPNWSWSPCRWLRRLYKILPFCLSEEFSVRRLAIHALLKVLVRHPSKCFSPRFIELHEMVPMPPLTEESLRAWSTQAYGVAGPACAASNASRFMTSRSYVSQDSNPGETSIDATSRASARGYSVLRQIFT